MHFPYALICFLTLSVIMHQQTHVLNRLSRLCSDFSLFIYMFTNFEMRHFCVFRISAFADFRCSCFLFQSLCKSRSFGGCGVFRCRHCLRLVEVMIELWLSSGKKQVFTFGGRLSNGEITKQLCVGVFSLSQTGFEPVNGHVFKNRCIKQRCITYLGADSTLGSVRHPALYCFSETQQPS